MKTDIYTSPDVFDLLANEWNPLLHRSATNTLFLTREWQKVWWQGLGEGDLHVLTMRDDAGQLAGIAPLFFSSGEISGSPVAFVGCREVSDYLDFIFERGHEPACLEALLDHLAGDDCPAWREIGLCNIPETSPTLSVLPAMAAARGWQVEMRFEDVCPIVELPATFDDYLSMLDGKERRELTRKLRRASEDVELVFAQDAGALDRDMDDFIGLMTASMPSKAAFMTPRMNGFFHMAARAMFEAGWLELSFLEVNGERAAAYLNFVYDNVVLVYNCGLNPQKYAYLSPGQVLLGRLIEKAIQDCRRAFDFLQGNEEYKYKFGGKDLKLYTLHISR